MKPSLNLKRVDWTRYQPIYCSTQAKRDWPVAFSAYRREKAGAVYAVRGEDDTWTCGCCGKSVKVVW